ncbi:MAG: PilZ domain-containing protein [Planctomycetota bacterium]|nr:PilZ domain-containing protein [Planctomycetota bacterium]
MSDPKNSEERRLHKRFSIQGHVELGGSDGPAMLQDISMSGLSCLSPRPFDDMTILEISMQLPATNLEQPFKAGGAVVRSEEQDDGNHLVAIFFTHMDEENRATLAAFIESDSES